MAGSGKGGSPRQRLLGDHVREARDRLGLSQEALAFKADMARSYVTALEAGRHNPSLETISKLAIAMETTAAALVDGAEAVAGRT